MNDSTDVWRVSVMQHPNGFERCYFNSLDEAWNFINNSGKICTNPRPISLFDAIKEQSNGK